MKKKTWRKHGFDFLTMFIAVISAFALNNWNDNRRDRNSADKILIELSNGMGKDLKDIEANMEGHRFGIKACKYFRKLITGQEINIDSLNLYYISLTRDYISVQNTAAYETLKSKGLELIQNDSLRLKIISLYEHDYSTLRKLEEEYSAMQFHNNYFKEISKQLAPYLEMDQKGNIAGIKLPVLLNKEEEKILLLYLLEIRMNRTYNLDYYKTVKEEIISSKRRIEKELN